MVLESTGVHSNFLSAFLILSPLSSSPNLMCVFISCAAYLADSSHTNVPPPGVTGRTINHGAAVTIVEVFSSWHAVQLTGVLSCQRDEFHFRIKPSSLDSFPHLTPIFDAHYMVLQTHKHHNFYFASDLHNMGATCSVSPGSRCHRTGCTALHGNPWLPPDSPECNNKRQQRSQRTNK